MTSLAMSAASEPAVDAEKRTVAGLAVPFGPVGQTSAGRLTFAAGSLRWSDPRRVKLLREHDQRDPVGHAVELAELTAAEVDERLVAAGLPAVGVGGVWATFRVPEGPDGDRALAQARDGLRDALSVGVQLDDRAAERVRRSGGKDPAQGSGQLREVSLVSVPAFDDARVGAVAHAELVVASWSPAPTERTDPMPEPVDQPAAPAVVAETPPPAAPPMAAAAGGAVVTGEAAVYTFTGSGPSLVADAYNAKVANDPDASARLARYNAQLVEGEPSAVMALAAVYKTTDTADTGPVVAPNTRRPDLLLQAVNNSRPILSRLNPVPIRNATPFLIPVETEFDGVGLHTEGTAHVAEGTYGLDEVTMTPRAISGAFRMSRELVDAANPAIDRLALAAMLRDYQRETEARVVAAFAAADTTATASVNTVNELRGRLLAFGDDTITPSLVVAGRTFLQSILSDTDSTGRPLLPYIGPTNASGTTRAGYTGFSVDGVEVVRATSLPTAEAYIVDAASLLVAESPAQTFRFEETEGPGIIKLALFGYFAVAVLRTGAVDRLTSV